MRLKVGTRVQVKHNAKDFGGASSSSLGQYGTIIDDDGSEEDNYPYKVKFDNEVIGDWDDGIECYHASQLVVLDGPDHRYGLPLFITEKGPEFILGVWPKGENTMADIEQAINNSKVDTDSQILRAHGIEDNTGRITDTGKRVLVNMLYAENKVKLAEMVREAVEADKAAIAASASSTK